MYVIATIFALNVGVYKASKLASFLLYTTFLSAYLSLAARTMHYTHGSYYFSVSSYNCSKIILICSLAEP